MKARYLLVHCALVLCVALMNVGQGDVTVSTDDGQGADTWLNYFHQSTNYGTETGFYLSKNYVPYMKFDLSTVGDAPVVDPVGTLLSLYGTPEPNELPGYNATFTIYGLADGSDNWGETLLTYDNAAHVANPISDHPYLAELGTLDYTNGDEGVITLSPNGTEMVDFLNNRGPDGLVTIIIASGYYTTGYFFSTKEDHGDASEAPFLEVKTGAGTIEHNNWLGNTSDNWAVADNWRNEDNNPEIPDVNDVAYLSSGDNYPVVVDSAVVAGKLFVHTGGLEVVSGSLTLSSSVLRIQDGVTVDVISGEIKLKGNACGLVGALIDDGKIVTSNADEEPFAEYVDLTDQTVVSTRVVLPQLYWDTEIVSADGPVGSGGNPAVYCVDRSGITGDIHARYTSINSYYARDMYLDEPCVVVEFDRVYELTDMWVWNYEDSFNGFGFKQVRIEYSTDGVNYNTLMNGILDEFTFVMDTDKDGSVTDVISFAGVPAKYVRLGAVGGPGVGNYETGIAGRYILRELRFYHQGAWVNPKATFPYPGDGATVNTDIELSWTPGSGAVTGQDVWFSRSGEPLVKIADNIDASADTYSVTVDNLEDYVWRVDGRDGAVVTQGDEWAFSTRAWLRWQPTGEGVIAGIGSPGNDGTTGDRAVNESGIDEHLHDSFAWSNGWYHRNPNPADEPPLDIEFDKPYQITEMWVWNHDGTSGSESPIAIKSVRVEYSLDGLSYTTLMNGNDPCFVLPHGNTDGTHETTIDFDGAVARYVRFTPIGGIGVGNYGSTYGYKLRELRFYYKQLPQSDISGVQVGVPDGTVNEHDLIMLTEDWLHSENEVVSELAVDDFESGLGNWFVLDPDMENTTSIAVETGIVHGGSQSMRMSYDQTVVAHDEPTCSIVYVFAGGDADLSGYERLEAWQYNAAGNAPVVHRQIEFYKEVSPGVYDSMGVISAAQGCGSYVDQVVTPAGQWFLWDIRIPNIVAVNLTAVDAMVIRADHVPAGSTAGTGTIYYDDIRFVSEYCESDLPGDIDGDCASDLHDFSIMSNEWMQSSN